MVIKDRIFNFSSAVISKNNLVDKKWLSGELAGCEFKDKRHAKRLEKLLEQLWEGMGESIPLACQDWSNTKAELIDFSQMIE